ncbi:MFS transporter [Caldimonas brevitalea]|uniref:Major facilitator superfamily MFS_1 n=1 Tax=Caldimonas brevitalea TaxID=413882 RepID=A0A0G3BCZ0_9BURK|nr:MFS transporter [Caldimonas brevitalea]AKJ27207.1 major facilitator superfamily MFS_1 [Caldimonas brevitalea]
MNHTLQAQARRHVALLAVAQALLLTVVVGCMAVSGLAGQLLAPDVSLATLPIAALVVGPFLVSWPAALLMERHGRRWGFWAGAGLCAAGALVSALGAGRRDFWVFCLGHLLLGGFQGFGSYHRFAAMEAATEEGRERAMSWVIGGGVVAALAGPALAHATRALGPVDFTGAYLAMAALSLAYALVVGQVRLAKPTGTVAGMHRGRPLVEILRTGGAGKAMVTAASAYAVMVLAMTATPLVMVNCGLGAADARSVIQWHVLGMFVPSFFTGRLLQRFQAERVALAGVVLLSLHVAIAVSGLALWQFGSSLVLLGVGWNFAFLGGTALLAQTHRPQERAKVQACNELIVAGVSAFASLSSGWLLHRLGWQQLNLVLLVPLVVASITLLPAVRRAKPSAAAAVAPAASGRHPQYLGWCAGVRPAE